MRNLYIFILLSYLTSCNSSNTSNTFPSDQSREIKDSITEKIETQIKYEEHKIEKIDTDFLCDCDSLEFWQGGIQGVERSDSTGIYCMGQCCTNLNFDIILFSKEKVSLNDCSEFKKDKKNKRIYDNLSGVEYYVFEIPKTKPLEPENEFDVYDYVFPSEVRIYKKFDDGWFLIRKMVVNSFEQLGRLKVNTIF